MLVLTWEERQFIENETPKLHQEEGNKVARINSEISLLRHELNTLRPLCVPFERDYRYQVFNAKLKQWVWTSSSSVVYLKQFNANPQIELKAAEIGRKIYNHRKNIIKIIRDSVPKGRKEMLRNID